MALLAEGRNYRLIGHEVGLNKNTVTNTVKRHRANSVLPIRSPKVPGWAGYMRNAGLQDMLRRLKAIV
jgi:hypothetical protein